jgi:flagellar hook-associated protein 3 FlgL
MKTSTISSSSISNAIRYTRMKAQEELAAATKEATTGRYADVGAKLGAKTTRSVDLNSEVMRLENLKATNSIATSRLGASQATLSQMSKEGQTILNTLVALGNNADVTTISTAATTIGNAFASFTDLANTSFNGEYLFAGINTDVKPLNDYNDPATPAAKTAVTNALNTFLAAQAPPLTSVSEMSGTQMDDFITNTLTPMFTGAGWNTNWSSATDQNMTSRVNRSEVIQTSTNANTSGFRNMALVGVIAQEILSKNLTGDARKVASDKAVTIAGLAITGIDGQRTALGLSEARIKQVNESLDDQKNIIETHLGDLEGVDGYEASTRVNLLKALVESSYTLTTQLMRMSLADYLK